LAPLPAVLAYHKIGTPELGGTWCRRAQLRAQLHALRSAGVRAIDLDTFARRVDAAEARRAARLPAAWRPEPDAPEVLVTFDDAFASFAAQAWPELQAAAAPAVVFVVTEFIGRRATWDWPLPGRRVLHLDWAALRALVAAGVAVGAHGATHRDLRRLADRALDGELRGARSRLEDGLGTAVGAIAYPFGRTDARVRAATADAGYTLGFSMCPPRAPQVDRLALRRHGVYVIDGPRSVLDKVDGRRRGHALQERLERGINACAGLVAAMSSRRSAAERAAPRDRSTAPPPAHTAG
jgi:peptidoglycan/xylan/chitin deacetylase (PgdA/CDA1 family)